MWYAPWIDAHRRAAALGVGGALLLSAAASAATPPVDEVVVTAKRIEADAVIAARVEEKFAADPSVFDEHVTVTVKNGVAVLRGIALDYWDVLRMKVLAKKVPGVKRVVDDLDVRLGGE
jgi:osmotically-inducible protein OsmY